MPSATETTVKRRACDECRTRKLACSKDPDGCERCKRENIACNYSEQKPMGRPRKRQHVEDQQAGTNPTAEALDVGAMHFDSGYADNVAEPYLSSGLAALEQGPSAVFLSDNPVEDRHTVWPFAGGSTGPPIDFETLDFDLTEGSIPITQPVPELSANSRASISDSDNSSSPAGPCSCLASMYLALAALQQLPTEILPALLAVRSAARTASESIWCPKCGSVALDNPNPPMDAFQNTMLLGTILPIIANGYQKLLDMVDKETEIATAAGHTKAIKFNDYGGLCGRPTIVEIGMTNYEKTMCFEALEMPPQQWRTTVRSMLRNDIYGHEQPGFNHKGLKDLVQEMEFRQKTRHEMLEAHHRHGLMPADVLQARQCPGERVHTCLAVLKVAKFAIDQLVIA